MNVKDILAYEGFTGISVALLGLSNPIGIIFAGILIGYLHLGGFQMQLFGFVPEIIEIVTAVIIYLCAFVLLIKVFFTKIISKSKAETDKPAEEPPGTEKPPGDQEEPPQTEEPPGDQEEPPGDDSTGSDDITEKGAE